MKELEEKRLAEEKAAAEEAKKKGKKAPEAGKNPKQQGCCG